MRSRRIALEQIFQTIVNEVRSIPAVFAVAIIKGTDDFELMLYTNRLNAKAREKIFSLPEMFADNPFFPLLIVHIPLKPVKKTSKFTNRPLHPLHMEVFLS